MIVLTLPLAVTRHSVIPDVLVESVSLLFLYCTPITISLWCHHSLPCMKHSSLLFPLYSAVPDLLDFAALEHTILPPRPAM